MIFHYRYQGHEYRFNVDRIDNGRWTAECLGYSIVTSGDTDEAAIRNTQAALAQHLAQQAPTQRGDVADLRDTAR